MGWHSFKVEYQSAERLFCRVLKCLIFCNPVNDSCKRAIFLSRLFDTYSSYERTLLQLWQFQCGVNVNYTVEKELVNLKYFIVDSRIYHE